MSNQRATLLLVIITSSLLTACIGPFSNTPEPLQGIRQQWQAAAETGDAQAQFHLGQSYCCSGSSGHSTRTALHWYCRAALQGHAGAQFEMANILAGKQLDKSYNDDKSAYMWYTVAAAQGNRQALEQRRNMGQRMSATATREARHWATRWTQAHCPW